MINDHRVIMNNTSIKDAPDCVADMRAIIERKSRDVALIYRILQESRYLGRSGEDTYTILAWHLLEENERLRDMAITYAKLNPSSAFSVL